MRCSWDAGQRLLVSIIRDERGGTVMKEHCSLEKQHADLEKTQRELLEMKIIVSKQK